MGFLRGHNNICRLYEIGIAKSSNYMIAKRLRIWSGFIFIDPCKIGKKSIFKNLERKKIDRQIKQK